MKKNDLIKLFSKKETKNLDKQNILKIFSSIEQPSDKSINNLEKNSRYKVLWENFMKENEMISIRKHDRFSYIPAHSHNYIELFIILQGEIHQNILGKKITLKAGELIFLNQKIEHEIEQCGEKDVAVNIIIRPKFFESIFDFICFDSKIRNFFLDSIFSYKSGNGLIFKTSEVESVQTLIYQILSEFINLNELSNYKIKLLISLLIIELVKESKNMIEINYQSYENDILFKVLNYIENNYTTASLEEVSQELNCNNYYISKLIKKNLNTTFIDIVQSKRLEKAVQLLETSDFTITHICETVGYENWNFFYKIFKNKFNMTPGAYSKKFKNSQNINN